MENEMQELLKQYRLTKDKLQNEFIDKVFDMVEHLSEKTNRKDYVATDHEREVFRKIYIIITNMNNWF